MRYHKGEVTDSQDHLNVKLVLIHPSAGHCSGYPHISSNELHKEGLWPCLCRAILMQRPPAVLRNTNICPLRLPRCLEFHPQWRVACPSGHSIGSAPWNHTGCEVTSGGFPAGSSQRKGRVGPWRYTPELWSRQLKRSPCPHSLHSPITAMASTHFPSRAF